MVQTLTLYGVTNYCCKSLEKCVATVTVRLIFLSFKKNVSPSNILGIRFFVFVVWCFVLLFFFWFWILVFFGVFNVAIFFIFHNLYCYSKTDRQITTFSRTLKNTSWCHVLMYTYIYRYTKHTHKYSPEKKKKRITLQPIKSSIHNGGNQILIQRRDNSLMISFFKVFGSRHCF